MSNLTDLDLQLEALRRRKNEAEADLIETEEMVQRAEAQGGNSPYADLKLARLTAAIPAIEAEIRDLENVRERLIAAEEAEKEKAAVQAAQAAQKAMDAEQARQLAELARQADTREFEERTFWFRRFHTSLGLAHGGAFAALAAQLFNPETTPADAGAAWWPMALFACGMVLAGVIPVALQRRQERTGWALAGVSAALFVLALLAALIAVFQKGQLAFPWQL